ncbi:anaerobic ribonucleoside-triphosphate reductase activating protein [bacterium CG2_30_37_16]|nr:MAG: anaerobic ribonucleoside-triphosphate reductase activating protein [bacterium CG2_30_37_16]PIP30548.1 MAG: anaerobic ribonucleoside-triphosphate reductase activating protein [bacterium (Candidatus Howlettbacteria) CG23_combo_of_CG06-09_8_20_14_all_37_9]PIX98946.1 MAG: anaerobic ribonucleoside-triphosphate reductase activating protein [bacterium (Candidatus Howlettbacteria) CG_4_10_14_3_um_filter_37_10]PJB07220.1 MAG: anaerobic ribonucleoside-triphosphate reductase activating protein [bac
MKIGGFQKTTLIDYPGKIAASIFTVGCNFRCGYCHNPDLIDGRNIILEDEAKVLEFFKKRKNTLEGVVISGGEPLLQKDLQDFIMQIKNLGLLVKLDTNGSNPQKLKKLLDQKLVDYVAMDIKNNLSSYDQTTNIKGSGKNIAESIDLIINSYINYEFRSTVLPDLHNEKNIEEIGIMIKGARKMYLQSFRSGVTLDEKYATKRSFAETEMENLKTLVLKNVLSCDIRFY